MISRFIYLNKLAVKPLIMFLFILVIFSTQFLNAQDTFSLNLNDPFLSLDAAYGNDPFLVNGSKNTYSYYKYAGHPYLYMDEFMSSRLSVKGKIYQNVPLKYDIYHNRLIFSFQNVVGGQDQILLNNALIDSFELNGQFFINLTTNPHSSQFYHVRASSACCKFLTTYRKEVKIITSNSSDQFEFTDTSESLFLMNGEGELISVRRMADLKKSLSPDDYYSLVKEKKLKFNLKKATNDQLVLLLKEIDSLENN